MLGAFDYVCVHSVDEGCRLLAQGNGTAAILAGGTDLLVEIRNHLKAPSLLIDIKGIDALQRMEANVDGPVTIGANVPLNAIVESAALRERYPALAAAAESIGTYQLRNRATLTGNLCNASPAADGAPPLLVLEAEVAIAGPNGSRMLPISSLFAGVKRTHLRPGEIVTSVTIPDPGTEVRSAFVKQQRIRGHDLAVVNAAAAYAPVRGRLRVAIGSCSATPLTLEPVDVQGVSVQAAVERTVALAKVAVSPISDVRASAEYRSAVLPALLRRLIERVLDSKGGN